MPTLRRIHRRGQILTCALRQSGACGSEVQFNSCCVSAHPGIILAVYWHASLTLLCSWLFGRRGDPSTASPPVPFGRLLQSVADCTERRVFSRQFPVFSSFPATRVRPLSVGLCCSFFAAHLLPTDDRKPSKTIPVSHCASFFIETSEAFLNIALQPFLLFSCPRPTLLTSAPLTFNSPNAASLQPLAQCSMPHAPCAALSR